MIEIPYFPGCTLNTKAKNLDLTARKIAKSFDYRFYAIHLIALLKVRPTLHIRAGRIFNLLHYR